MESAKGRLVHLGFGNWIPTDTIIAMALPKSAAILRSIQESRDKGLLIDMTKHRKTRAVIFTESRHIVLAAYTPDTIVRWLKIGT